MESVVAALLRDFESGKLTRRQLVQTLALMAVGSPVASAVAQSVAGTSASPAGTPWKTVWLDHISFQVSDYKKSVDFYTDLMTVMSVSEVVELSTAHARKQFEALTAQTKDLAALAQKVATDTAEPIKGSVTKAFSKVA